jgi:rod shape-determining protein MreC
MVRKHTKRRGLSAFVLSALIIVVLLVLYQRSVLDGPRSAVQRVLSPVQSGLSDGGKKSASFFGRLFKMWDAESRVSEQEIKIAQLESQLLKYQNIESENAFLRQQLNLSSAQPIPAVMAHIIAINPTMTNTLLLDAGSDAGVQKDAPVIVNGALFGYITSVEPRNSQLRLITDPKSIIEAAIPDVKARGVLEGTIGQKDLLLKEVSRDIELKPGMEVLAEGFGETNHTPLIVGKISEVIPDDKATTLSVRVAPTTKPKDVSDVLILLVK